MNSSLTDWFFFLVLNIGNATVEAIPVGTRLMVAAVQAVAVRLAGFQSVAIAALAPAVKCVLLFIILFLYDMCFDVVDPGFSTSS